MESGALHSVKRGIREFSFGKIADSIRRPVARIITHPGEFVERINISEFCECFERGSERGTLIASESFDEGSCALSSFDDQAHLLRRH